MRYFLIIFLLMTTSAEAAKIRVFKETNDGVFLSLRGEIKGRDTLKLRSLHHRFRYKRAVLFLYSGGGLMYEAMRLGNAVRQMGITTAIGRRGKCMSACTLIFMAGWDKYNGEPHRIKHPKGRLGLHHPHEVVSKKPSSPHVMMNLRRYFNYMQAGEGMYEIMARTPPTRMSYVKNRTLLAMGGYIVQTARIKWPKVKIAEGPAPIIRGHGFQWEQPTLRPGVQLTDTTDQMDPSNKGKNPSLPPGFWDYDKDQNYKPKPDLVELLRNIAGD